MIKDSTSYVHFRKQNYKVRKFNKEVWKHIRSMEKFKKDQNQEAPFERMDKVKDILWILKFYYKINIQIHKLFVILKRKYGMFKAER